ncbi:MAG TPA: hypothetical protein VFW98_08695 [Gemmatimonadaceae bacterium]|nr:hypothetical protein [Gemmatimonadaceae bacterium]
MTVPIPVFINAECVETPAGATVLDVLRQWSEEHAREVEAGRKLVLDSRGLPIALDLLVHAGTILRLISARDSAVHDPAR